MNIAANVTTKSQQNKLFDRAGRVGMIGAPSVDNLDSFAKCFREVLLLLKFIVNYGHHGKALSERSSFEIVAVKAECKPSPLGGITSPLAQIVTVICQ